MESNTEDKKKAGAPVQVQILGQTFMIKGTRDPAYVERLAAYVRRKIDEAAARGPVSSPKLAVLAALNIADDYFRVLDDSKHFKREVASRSRGMLRELDDRQG